MVEPYLFSEENKRGARGQDGKQKTGKRPDRDRERIKMIFPFFCYRDKDRVRAESQSLQQLSFLHSSLLGLIILFPCHFQLVTSCRDASFLACEIRPISESKFLPVSPGVSDVSVACGRLRPPAWCAVPKLASADERETYHLVTLPPPAAKKILL